MADNSGRTLKKRKVKHRFFVAPSRMVSDGQDRLVAELDHDTVHHLRNVLRLNTGAGVILFDNSGKEYEGEIIECRPSLCRVIITRSYPSPSESPLRINLGQALIKGNAFERVLTLCTELGISRFAPLFTSRTVVRLSKVQAADRVKRWERISREAAAQSGRVKIPIVEMPQDMKQFLEKKNSGLRIILWEKGGAGQLNKIIEDSEEKIEEVTLVAGPEGGFEQAEVKLAMEAGFKIWGLGPRIMRAEFAGAMAIGMLQYALGDMG